MDFSSYIHSKFENISIDKIFCVSEYCYFVNDYRNKKHHAVCTNFILYSSVVKYPIMNQLNLTTSLIYISSVLAAEMESSGSPDNAFARDRVFR